MCRSDMADPDPRYPCSSIEDDFNYGSCVASANVHIRMGTSPGPSRPPLVGPAAPPAFEASILTGRARGRAPVSWGSEGSLSFSCRPRRLGGRAFSLRRGSEGEEVVPQPCAQKPEPIVP